MRWKEKEPVLKVGWKHIVSKEESAKRERNEGRGGGKWGTGNSECLSTRKRNERREGVEVGGGGGTTNSDCSQTCSAFVWPTNARFSRPSRWHHRGGEE